MLRALLLKQVHGFSYRALAFHLADSQTYRTYCRLGWNDPAPSTSALGGRSGAASAFSTRTTSGSAAVPIGTWCTPPRRWSAGPGTSSKLPKRRSDPRAMALAAELNHYATLTPQVIWQTGRRVFEGQVVPATEKIVSPFEEHDDIICKDRRETFFGHEIGVTNGASSLVLECVVLDGNPADSTLTTTMTERFNDLYGRPPRQAAFDGGFASKANLKALKDQEVKDVAFSKRRGLAIEDMVCSKWVFQQLRHLRAGVEGIIFWLMRVFGLGRCTWRSRRSFHAYVWSSILSLNFLVLARKLLL